MRIEKAKARKILSSFGETVEVEINGEISSSPSGTSKSTYETFQVSNLDKAVSFFNKKVSKKLIGFELNSIEQIEELENFLNEFLNKIGGNLILATLMSSLKSLSSSKGIPLWKLFGNKLSIPSPLSKVVGGGMHAGTRGPEFQEFLVMTEGKNSFFKNFEILVEVGKLLEKQDINFNFGRDLEGGWVTNLSIEEVLTILKKLSKKHKFKIGVDIAANSLYDKGTGNYIYRDKTLSREEQIDYVLSLIKRYSLFYVEDPLYEDDFTGFAEITDNSKCLICGDDLLSTNAERLKKAIEIKACNACIVKPNQICSISKLIEFVNMAKKYKLVPVISHRSRESNDNYLSHIATGLQIPIIKMGISGGERTSKLNEFIRMGDEK